jgi:hypothetical protein
MSAPARPAAAVSRYRRQRGSESQTAVARWFAAQGWQHAEPVGAGRGGSDVLGMPGLLVEVKARREFKPVAWLRQHAGPAGPAPAPLPFVVWRPDGFGPAQIGSWGVMMRLDDFTALLAEAGYGDGGSDAIYTF